VSHLLSSCFSPCSSLLGSSSHSGHHHLPHHLKDYDSTATVSGTGVTGGARKESRHQSKKERADRKRHSITDWFVEQKKETHIKKPLNAFMLYMKEMRPVVQAECTLKESAAINQLLGRRVSTNLSSRCCSLFVISLSAMTDLKSCCCSLVGCTNFWKSLGPVLSREDCCVLS